MSFWDGGYRKEASGDEGKSESKVEDFRPETTGKVSSCDWESPRGVISRGLIAQEPFRAKREFATLRGPRIGRPRDAN